MSTSMQYAPKSMPPRGSSRQPTSKGMPLISSYKQQISNILHPISPEKLRVQPKIILSSPTSYASISIWHRLNFSDFWPQ